ncbi:MFS general substrate transporter [Fistulina hepatica ATCC 64428]|nr:MFS general substrate transporter [Fistulina hepatica ATCC 64428]
METSTTPLHSHKNTKCLKLFLTCCSAACNAVAAGGVFTFPLISQPLATHLKLSQPELTTIVLAGMAGQYPIAPLAGKLLDRFGASVCSLVASVMFSLSYGIFAFSVSRTPDDISQSSPATFRTLVFCFVLAGMAVVCSYFSSLFTATHTFPHYPGIAAGFSMALFGLSPLVLSSIASTFFMDTSTDAVNVTHYMAFLAIFTGIIHALGSVILPSGPLVERAPVVTGDLAGSSPDETTRLLNEPPDQIEGAPPSAAHSTLDLLRELDFWVFLLIVAVNVGVGEMVISNIGTIVLSLSPGESSGLEKPAQSTASQVKILSATNTLSRLIVGPLSDFLSPVLDEIVWRKHHISRVSFLFAASFIIVASSLWMAFSVDKVASIWILSVSTGIVYGTTFTVIPSLLASIWGRANVGRNFGLISYAPFAGTPIFSYLYAFVADWHTDGDGLCRGTSCWRATFLGTGGAATFACLCSVFLWIRWKGRV